MIKSHLDGWNAARWLFFTEKYTLLNMDKVFKTYIKTELELCKIYFVFKYIIAKIANKTVIIKRKNSKITRKRQNRHLQNAFSVV